MAEDAASCKGCIFRLRFGFRRALYEKLFLVRVQPYSASVALNLPCRSGCSIRLVSVHVA